MWTEAQLDDRLSTPSQALIADLDKLDGDIMILGAGGKVGPTLSIMAKRAVEKGTKKRRVIAVSRFTDPIVVELLAKEGVETMCADLTDASQIAALPKAENIIYMAGRKFGTSGSACETWEMNVAVPALVTRHFGAARYVVFSTSNVYPFTNPCHGGCDESVAPSPIGEYAISCLGRERMFEYAARHYGAKVVQFRLSYAVDLRYGVLHDLCQWIMEGKPIPLGMPAFNCVWQGYCNEVALRALTIASENVEILNVTGPELVGVRNAALRLGALLNKDVEFGGTEGEVGLLTNAQKCVRLFGYPEIGVTEMMELQADWILSGGRELGKPTHFEEQKGKF